MKFFVLLFLFLPSLAASQPIPKVTYQAILQAQDLRDTKAIAGFLADKNFNIRARAGFACGSIQDTRGWPLVLRLTTDPRMEVRIAATFALGQLQFVADSAPRAKIWSGV